MRSVLAILWAASLVWFTPTTAAGQGASPKPAKSVKPAKADKPAVARELTLEQQNALGLLTTLADQTFPIESAATRVRLLAAIADMQWDADPAKGRALFKRAFDEADDIEGNDTFGTERTSVLIEVIQAANRHDPQLANEFLQDVEDYSGDDDTDYLPFGNQSQLSALLMGLARERLATDPTAAAGLAYRALDGGVPADFASFLAQLAQKSRVLADELLSDALVEIEESATTPIDLYLLAGYVFPNSSWGGFRIGASSSEVSPETARRYLAAVLRISAQYVARTAESSGQAATGAVDIGVAQGVHAVLSQLLPMYELYLPEELANVQSLVLQVGARVPAEQVQALSSYYRAGESVDALVAEGESATQPAMKLAYFVRAAMLSYQNDHDYARAKAITAKIDNEEWRRNILGAIAAHAAVGVAREGRYDEALRIAEDVAALEQRAQVYTQMAFAAIDARDQQRGREILDAAEKLMPKGTATMSAELAAALVWLANSYVRLDKQRGFEVMQTAIDALNKVDLAEASTDAIKFGSSSVPIRRFDTGPGFEGLAKTDYFRSLLMAQSLKHRELAIAAQLAVIRGVLSMEPLPPEKTETPKKKETKATARPRTRQLVKPLSIPEEPANPPSAAPADDPDTRRLPDSGRKPATEGDPER